jgi:ABC-type branched-subunit amino acid transport system permease subunit
LSVLAIAIAAAHSAGAAQFAAQGRAHLLACVEPAATQSIRIADMMIVAGEWSVIEEIISAQVVVMIRDLRQLVAPLSCFIEKPLQNWTRENAALIGIIYFCLAYRAPIGVIPEKLKEFVEQSKFWNGKKVASVQVTEDKPRWKCAGS